MTNLQKINKNVISIQFVFRGGFKEAEANTVKKKKRPIKFGHTKHLPQIRGNRSDPHSE